MTDCPNVEMRDRLPDLANDSLEPSLRVLVLAHLDECAACTAEIEILRTTRLILVTATPKVNVASIVSALPQYGVTSITAAPSARRRTWASSWAVAAAVTVFAAGLGSYAMIGRDGTAGIDSTLVADATPGFALTGALADLGDAELDALARDIASIEALPSTDIVDMGHSITVPTILPDSVVREMED